MGGLVPTVQSFTRMQTRYIETFLTSRCTIRRSEPGTADQYGGRSQRKSAAYVGTPCRVQRAKRPQTVDEGYQRTALYDWEVILPTGVRVQLEDAIEVEGQTYEVKGSDAGTTDALTLTAYCTRAE